jgi:hypothetical protein
MLADDDILFNHRTNAHGTVGTHPHISAEYGSWRKT